MANYKKIHLVVRVVLILVPVIFLSWLTTKYFAFSGHLKASYDFSEESPFISILWPPQRTSGILFDDTGDAYQEIQVDPVTFSVKMTRPTFRNVKLRVKYQIDPGLPFQIGLQEMDKDWKFRLKDPKVVGKDGEWLIGMVSFDLRELYIKDKTIKFLFSSPYLDQTGKVIKISQIDVDLQKEPVTLENFFGRLSNFIKREIRNNKS